MVSACNGNHMPNANATFSMSAPAGSCDALPPTSLTHTHTLYPTAGNLRCRLYCFPRCLIFCTKHSFVLHAPSPPPFFFFTPLAVVLSFKCTPSDLACNVRRSCVHFTLFQSPILLGFVWYWSSGCKILHDDYIDLYLWLISSFTVIMAQH